MPNLHFHTSVSGSKDGVHYIRNHPLSELVGQVSYARAVYYMITGIMPTDEQEYVLNAILVASMDHGISPASGFVPRVVASTGNNLVHSIAAGILALGPYHGLAITGAAEVLQQVREHGVESLQESHFSKGKRILGLGHPHYKHTDPRTDQLFALAKEAGISTQHQEVAYAIQAEVFKTLEKHLVINIDMAIATLLLDLGFPPEAGDGLFALSRVGGMIAHVLEEHRNEKPVRRIDESEIAFTLPGAEDGQEE
jgi:citrate synthase